MSKITVIDSKPGKGKTSFAIQMMKERYDDKFIYITPFLNECERIRESCENRYFLEPNAKSGKGSKLKHFNELLKEGKIIKIGSYKDAMYYRKLRKADDDIW